MLNEWKLWDHMDAILSLGVTRWSIEILAGRERLDRRRLAARSASCPRSVAVGRLLRSVAGRHPQGRWHRLRRKLRYSTWWAHWDLVLGIAVTVAMAVLITGSAEIGLG